MPATKIDYGVDAPGVIRKLLLIGILLVVAAYFVPSVAARGIRLNLAPMFLTVGIVLVLEGVLMIAYAKFGKYRHRDRMLNMIRWRGDEGVLDVGTGRGLLLIGAAKRLRAGKAVGIDVWNARDLSGNSRTATLRNAELEGVANRVEVYSEDAVHLRFSNNSFDVVLSNLCLHNIPTGQARAKACQEIARVLKPGGTALISDFKNTGQCARAFTEAGLTVKQMGPYLLDTFPPLRILSVQKP